MTWKITPTQQVAAAAWVLTLNRVDERDRTHHAINAISDLGNVPVVRCADHDDPDRRSMTFSEAVEYLRQAPGEHDLYADYAEVELV